jgi:hypothetical protein
MAGGMLSNRELKGLVKLGEALIPKNSPFPSFSETGCVALADIALKGLPSKDLRDLKAFLRVVSFFHKGLVLLALKLLEAAPVADLRKASLGVKALAMSLYYSGKASPGYRGPSPLELIGYRINRVPL